jgi:hypothetical protein
MRLMRWEGGDMRISHVLWMTVMGRRRTAARVPVVRAVAVVFVLVPESALALPAVAEARRGVRRSAAGGSGEWVGRDGEMLLDVVARRIGGRRARGEGEAGGADEEEGGGLDEGDLESVTGSSSAGVEAEMNWFCVGNGPRGEDNSRSWMGEEAVATLYSASRRDPDVAALQV